MSARFLPPPQRNKNISWNGQCGRSQSPPITAQKGWNWQKKITCNTFCGAGGAGGKKAGCKQPNCCCLTILYSQFSDASSTTNDTSFTSIVLGKISISKSLSRIYKAWANKIHQLSVGRLWLRGRVLLSEGRWFDSPGLDVKVSLGKVRNPKLLLMCWSAPCMAAATVCLWMFKLLWTKVSAKCPQCKLKCFCMAR